MYHPYIMWGFLLDSWEASTFWKKNTILRRYTLQCLKDPV